MESDDEHNWLPIQVLNTVFSTPTLPEDYQVEIMKVASYENASIQFKHTC